MKKIFSISLKNWLKYLIYISIIFLVMALIKNDYLRVPKVYNYRFLLISFLFLFSGFIFQCLNWYFVLKKDYPVSLKDALVSFGFFVFTKYIPGKVFVIIGKAEYISKKYNYNRKDMITRSLDAQFIVLWTGIIIGSIGLFFANESFRFIIPLLTGWIVLSLIIFTDFFHKMLFKLIKFFTKKDINIPLISFREVLKILPVFFVYWIVFTAAFWFFSSALSEKPLGLETAFSFPLSVTLGIIMLVAPGGIGFRESILAGLLVMLSVDLQDATTISVVSRIWFLFGELFIFCLALVLKYFFSDKKEVINH